MGGGEGLIEGRRGRDFRADVYLGERIVMSSVPHVNWRIKQMALLRLGQKISGL